MRGGREEEKGGRREGEARTREMRGVLDTITRVLEWPRHQRDSVTHDR